MTNKVPLPDTDRMRAMIAEAAYFRAEQRGFAPGFDEQDWLAAENEVRTALAKPNGSPVKSMKSKRAPASRAVGKKPATVRKKKQA